MKTYKFREVFTVTRMLPPSTLGEAQGDFLHVKDEPGEYLYGGGGGAENIDVRLEMWNGQEWTKVDSSEYRNSLTLQQRLYFIPIGPTEPQENTLHHIALAMDWERKINDMLASGAEHVRVEWIDRPIIGYSKLLQPHYESELDHGFQIIATRTRQ